MIAHDLLLRETIFFAEWYIMRFVYDSSKKQLLRFGYHIFFILSIRDNCFCGDSLLDTSVNDFGISCKQYLSENYLQSIGLTCIGKKDEHEGCGGFSNDLKYASIYV
jgi:hypothetical protein